MGEDEVTASTGAFDDVIHLGEVREASGDDLQLIELWGKFWGAKSDFHGVFDLTFNHDRSGFVKKEFRAFEDRDVLEAIDVPEDRNEFSRNVATMRTTPSVPDSTIPQINSYVKRFFENTQNRSALIDGLMKHDEQSVATTVEEMVRKIIPRGEIGLEAGVSLTTESPVGSGDRTEDEGSSVETAEDEGRRSDEAFLDATVSTDPVKGKVPGKISVGDTVYVHIKGDLVERLPDKLKHDRYDNLTVPMTAEVMRVSREIDPPEGVDPEEFKKSNYWEIDGLLEEFDNKCRAVVQGDTMIKHDADDRGSGSPVFSFLLSPLALLWIAISLVAAIVLGYVFFGV